MAKTVTVLGRQSLMDVAVEHCGDWQQAFDIAMINGTGLTDDIASGKELTMPYPSADSEMANFYDVNAIHPATGITDSETSQILLGGEGIEFWGIEYDFVVS